MSSGNYYWEYDGTEWAGVFWDNDRWEYWIGSVLADSNTSSTVDILPKSGWSTITLSYDGDTRLWVEKIGGALGSTVAGLETNALLKLYDSGEHGFEVDGQYSSSAVKATDSAVSLSANSTIGRSDISAGLGTVSITTVDEEGDPLYALTLDGQQVLTEEMGDDRYVNSNEVYNTVSDAAQVNSRIIPATNVLITYTWPATNVAGTVYILGQTNTWISSTGSVEYATTDGSYLVDVAGTVETAPNNNPMVPQNPMDTETVRLSDTSIVIRAWCVAGGNGEYWAAITNAQPVTYDLVGMTPNSVISDGAGIIQRADNLPDGWFEVEELADGRLVVNVASLREFGEYCVEVAAAKWGNYTASGTRVPDSSFITIDEPLIQVGGMSQMQSGDYYAQTYVGGDWWQTTEGSGWYIGPSGSRAFGITSTNKILNLISFDVDAATDVATLDISTNGIAGDPEILTTGNLNPAGTNGAQWVKCPSQTMTNMTTYWRGQCDASADSRYFMVVSAGGECRIINKYPATFEQGIANAADQFLDFMTFTNAEGNVVEVMGRIVQ